MADIKPCASMSGIPQLALAEVVNKHPTIPIATVAAAILYVFIEIFLSVVLKIRGSRVPIDPVSAYLNHPGRIAIRTLAAPPSLQHR